MSSVVTIESLLDARRVWRGQGVASPSAHGQPTGNAALDAVLPGGGWPDAALSEIQQSAATGKGELHRLWPTLARLTRAGGRVVLIGPLHQSPRHTYGQQQRPTYAALMAVH